MNPDEDMWAGYDAVPGDLAERRGNNVVHIRANDAVADEPQFLADGAEPLTEEQVAEAQVRRPLFLADFLSTERVRRMPDLGEVDGSSLGLFYRGKYNTLIGEPSRGKSRLVQKIVADEARAGRLTLTLDWEKDFEDFAECMADFKVTPDEARCIAYWAPDRPLRGLMPTLLPFCAKYGIETVIIDSVGAAISMIPGYSEDNNDQVRDWFNRDVKPLLSARRTVLSTDHFRKQSSSAFGAAAEMSRYASGAGSKLRVVTGTAMLIQNVEPFAIGRPGWSKILAGKVNKGAYAEMSVAAELHVFPNANGDSVFEVRASSQPVDANGKSVPTVLMERVSRFVADFNGTPSKNQVMQGVSGNEHAKARAIDLLVEGKWLDVVPGPRNAKLLVHARDFHQDDWHPASAGGGFGGGGNPFDTRPF